MIKRITNYLFGILALIALVGLNAVDSNAGNRRLLVEDHTGANCGWCVLGNQAIEDMQAKYPNDFIGVGMHTNNSSYGDAMWTIFEPETAVKIGLTGYPSGAINRKAYSQGTAIHPAYWESIIDAEVGKPAVVDVAVDWNLNKTTGDLTATVTATMLANYNGQLAFNLYVMEDGIVGSGNGYDQHNYVSGYKGYENHPYFSKPSVLTNYEHNNVLRDLLGGSWGVTAEFPATVTSGQTFSHTFTTNIKNKVTNLSRAYVIGAVMETGTKMEILNALQVGKIEPVRIKAPIVADASTHYVTANAMKEQTMTFTVSNPGTKAVTTKIELASTAFIPDTWSYQLDKTMATLAPGASETVKVTINPMGKAGYAVVALKSTPEIGDGEAATVTNAESYALSDASKYIWYLGTDDNLAPQLQSAMAYTQFYDKAAFVPFAADVLSNYASVLASTDLAIVSIDWAHRGALTTPDYTGMLQLMQSMMTAGKKVLITSAVELINAGGANPNATEASKAFFHDYFGITNNGDPLTVNTQQNNQTYITPVDCFGFADDFVGKGKTLKVNQISQTYQYYSFFLDKIKITGTNLTPSMYYTFNGATQMDAISAVRYEKGNTRAWFSTFGFDLIQDIAQRTDLFQGVVNWLINGEETAPAPVISVSTNSIDFGDIREGESADQKFTVSNTGNMDLEINEITMDFETEGFTLKNDYSLPIVIKSGESTEFTVTFTGEEGNLDAKSDAINFMSNDIENPTVSVNLNATTIAKDATPAPKIAVSKTSLTWVATPIGESVSKTFDIQNKGTGPLIISNITIDGTTGDAFSIVDMPSLPLNIDKGQKVTIMVDFAPQVAKEYVDVVTIASNDTENPMVDVDLVGTAITSVRDGIAGDEGIFTMTATPSPMSTAATIKYNVFGNTPRNVSMYIIDNTGAKVQTLVNKSVLGENTMNFDATKLANGSYFIIANLDGYQAQLPIVIAR